MHRVKCYLGLAVQLVNRLVDVIDDKYYLENLHSIKDFPIHMTCTTDDAGSDLTADLVWQISPTNGVVQLKSLIPLDILYHTQHSGNVGRTWHEHHASFARFVNEYRPGAVLEIGGGHGVLAVEYNKLTAIDWTIVDPTPNPVPHCPATYVKQLFDENFDHGALKFDTVVHSHVFEHMYEPSKFIQHLSSMMPLGQNMVFSIPNLAEMLRRNYTNAINFEHTVLLTEPYIDYILAKNGFAVIEKKYFKDDHSIFYACRREHLANANPLPANLYELNRTLYKNYIAYHADLIESINSKLQTTTQPVYLFGAHVFAQYLIKSGLDTTRIVNILDNDSAKQNKRLYGTSLNVLPPEILRNVKDPIVILKAGAYNNEIMNQLTEINETVQFL